MDENASSQMIPFTNGKIQPAEYDIIRKIKEEGKEIVWETVKELVIKEIPIFGKAFSVAENINNKKQVDNIIKGLQYIWHNFNLLSNELEEKLDKDFANEENAEFVTLVKQVLENITKQYKDEKVKYLANFLANSTKKEFSKAFYKEGILDKVSKYSIEHILILKHFYDVESHEGTNSEENRKKPLDCKINLDTLCIEGIDNNIKRICIRDLESDGFIDEVTGAFYGYSGGNYYLTGYGKLCIELLKDLESE